MKVVEGDVGDRKRLLGAMKGKDIVYPNLAGEVDVLAKDIIAGMKEACIKRLVFIASLGIYDEVPGKFGKWNKREIGEMLVPYRKAADLIEKSGLDYTIIRPAWLTDNDEIDFETTKKGEPFKGTEVSRKSVAAYVMRILENPGFASSRMSASTSQERKATSQASCRPVCQGLPLERNPIVVFPCQK